MSTLGEGSAPARLPTLRHSVGFWVVAVAFTAVMAYSTVPTPLYGLYEAADGFPPFVVTFVFAAYAVGVVAALYFAGHLSDVVGRRRMILIAVGVEIVAAVVFLVWSELPGLLVARFVNGAGVGLLTATATAHISELRSRARPDEDPANAVTVSGIANLGGLGLGPLIGGLFAEFLPAPLLLPHLVFLVLFVVSLVALLMVPETVTRPAESRPYRPQRISVPPAARPTFVAAGAAAFSAFAVFGLFTSLAPTFLVVSLHETDRLVAGAVSFSVFAAACVAQVLFRGFSIRRQLRLVLTLMPAGLVLLSAGALLASLPLFAVGGVVSGAGVGLLFRCALARAGATSSPETRGEVLAAVFLIGYAGLSVPVLLVGAALLVFAPATVLVAFAALLLVAVLVSATRLLHQDR
ncbi:MFS transporter [Curtobacterium sp. PhB115]|uniref:MFS transporter n=1 Tax=Curtobacterium sp. PhB115 TaxID=2485173 RepID=UPI000F4B3D1C|nr:MFS transporter [Curtobacterium sp. PhB115]ROP65460.1 putative MFS family arabinose efflux permease [Curtobacterium sp. PhB115]